MTLAGPGSSLWLLRHELRLGWRAAWSSQKGRGRRILLAVVAVALIGGAFALGIPFALFMSKVEVTASPMLYAGVDLALAVILSLMVAQGLNAATLALYERRDLDLLLSSPIAANKVLTVRALAIAVNSVALFVALATPFALSLAVFGAVRWLAIYPVLVSMALAATALGLAVAMGLFALIGPRATRVFAQVLAAVIGASFFLASQLGNMAGRGRGRALVAQAEEIAGSGWFDPGEPATWPARAALGEPLPLLLFTAAGVLLFAVTTQALGRAFAADAARAAGAGGGGRKRAAREPHLGGFAIAGSTASLVRKELKLLARDPFLISQVLMQLLYLIPLAIVIWRNALGSADYTAAAGVGGVVFLTSQLVGNLAWITVSAEDAPDLIAASPVGKRRADRAKALAAALPVIPLTIVPIAGLAWLSPWAGVTATAAAVAAAVSSASINIWHQRPGKRSDFRKSRRASWMVSLAETGVAFGWSGAAALLTLWQPWWVLPAGAAAGLVVLLRRPAPDA